MVARCGLKVTVRHHEACRVMRNIYPEWRNFQFALKSHFLYTLPLTVVFKLEYALFYQFYAKMSSFSIKRFSIRLLSSTSRRHARGRLTSPRMKRKYPERMKITENIVGCTIIFCLQLSVNHFRNRSVNSTRLLELRLCQQRLFKQRPLQCMVACSWRVNTRVGLRQLPYRALWDRVGTMPGCPLLESQYTSQTPTIPLQSSLRQGRYNAWLPTPGESIHESDSDDCLTELFGTW